MAIRVSPLFSDGMVVQRDKPLRVVGETTPWAAVQVSFQGVRRVKRVGEDGRFSIKLGEFPINSEPSPIIIQSNEEVLTINDVVVGDVWLLVGQSNMELWLSRTAHNYPDALKDDDQLIRYFAVPQEPKFDAPRDALNISPTRWVKLNPKTAPDFSAVGYFLAKRLRERYDVPIGLLAAAVGGTPIAAWLSEAECDKLGIDCAETHKCADPAFLRNMQDTEAAATAKYMADLDNADLGLRGDWASPDYDDSEWESGQLTDHVLGSGSHWYRRTITVPADMAGARAEIYLGTAIDMDDIFINGVKIGTTGYRFPPRRYAFVMPDGTCTVALRLLTFSGGGEFTPGKNRFIATDIGTIPLDGPWRRRTAALTTDAPTTTFARNLPTALYNGMIAPLAHTGLKGIAWYQGESDTGRPYRYGDKLKALITSWRRLFDDPKLPFLIQQIAHWHHTGPGGPEPDHHQRWEILRLEQKRALQLNRVGLSGGYDVGEYNDLHPQGKQVVGERLARLASRVAYGEKLPPNMFEQYHL